MDGQKNAKLKRQSQKIGALAKAVSPSVQTYVSTKIMGAGSEDVKDHETRTLLIGGSRFDFAKLGKNHYDQENGQNRAVVSHARAQAAGTASLLEDDKLMHAWSACDSLALRGL